MTTIIRSIEEMLDRDKWEGKDIRLESDNGLIWRASENRDPIYIEEQDNFTIDGGDQGITIWGTGLCLFKCKNVRLKNLTIRLGVRDLTCDHMERWDKKFDKYHGEALKLFKCDDVKVKNCTLSWGIDETLSIDQGKEIQILNCMVVEPINNPVNANGQPLTKSTCKDGVEEDHAFPNSTKDSEDVLYDCCVFARGVRRFPQFSPNKGKTWDCDLTRSILYNYTDSATVFNGSDSDGKDFRLEFSDNYYTPHEAGKMKCDGNDSEFLPIDIEGPDDGEVIVKYANNVMGTPTEFAANSGTTVVPCITRKKKNVELKDRGDQNPSMSFEEILEEAGPKGILPEYTRCVKKRIKAGVLLEPLTPREPDLNNFTCPDYS